MNMIRWKSPIDIMHDIEKNGHRASMFKIMQSIV